MTDDDALIDLVAAHRPYGMDCRCGRPINSDRDWATHLIDGVARATKWSRDGECTCNHGPDTDGPDEFCPWHGRPYRELVEILDQLAAARAELTQEWGAAVGDPDAPLPYFHSTDQLPEAEFAAAGLDGGYVVSRLVGPWRKVPTHAGHPDNRAEPALEKEAQ